jgi:hypothetical protein
MGRLYWNATDTSAGCLGAAQTCAGAATDAPCGSAAVLPACADSGCPVRTAGAINVAVTGVQPGGGRLRLGVASSSAQWNRGQPQWGDAALLQATALPRAGAPVTMSVPRVPYGVYAFVVLHDADMDGAAAHFEFSTAQLTKYILRGNKCALQA